jgi:uncharacterized membrane protein
LSKISKKERRLEEKQRKELEEARKRRNKTYGILGVIMVIALSAIIFFIMSSDNPEGIGDPNVGGQTDVIEIPLSRVTESAKTQNYNSNGVTVKYFVVKGSDGQVHTAFDACDVCFQEKKGYSQDGQYMVCRNCGNSYTTNQIGTANTGGGCWPGYLKHRIEDGNLIIEKSDLDLGRRYFK